MCSVKSKNSVYTGAYPIKKKIIVIIISSIWEVTYYIIILYTSYFCILIDTGNDVPCVLVRCLISFISLEVVVLSRTCRCEENTRENVKLYCTQYIYGHITIVISTYV